MNKKNSRRLSLRKKSMNKTAKSPLKRPSLGLHSSTPPIVRPLSLNSNIARSRSSSQNLQRSNIEHLFEKPTKSWTNTKCQIPSSPLSKSQSFRSNASQSPDINLMDSMEDDDHFNYDDDQFLDDLDFQKTKSSISDILNTMSSLHED